MFSFNNLLFSHKFFFKDKKGDQYQLRSFSIQEVLLNNRLNFTVDQKYVGELKVLDKINDKASITGNYYYYSKPYKSAVPYTLQNRGKIKTQFNRFQNGKIEIADHLLFPVVRHVPTFPNKDIKINEGWVEMGEEAQDLSQLGLAKPHIIPLKARYRYLKDTIFRGRKVAVIEVVYVINWRKTKAIQVSNAQYPVRIMGYFKGNYYWDKEAGHPLYYNGNYDFIYTLVNGKVIEFRGIEYGDIIKNKDNLIAKNNFDKTDSNDIKKEIVKQLKEKKLNFPVKEEDKKIKINLGELLFDFDSHQLKRNTILQLDRLAQLLMKYDNYNISVEGHTDSIGTTKVNKTFSKKRAQSVRDYLVEKGVSPEKIKSIGLGESQPVESNKTDSGRAKNRRVEIIIDLDETDKKQ